MKTKIFTLISVISFSIYNSEASIDGYINDNRDGLENNNPFVTPKKERNKEIECPNAPERRKCHAKKQSVSKINLSRNFNGEIDSRRVKYLLTPPKNFDIIINSTKDFIHTPEKDTKKKISKNEFISATVDNAMWSFNMTIDGLIQELKTYKEYRWTPINNVEENNRDVRRRLDFDSSDDSVIFNILNDENYTSSDEKCISSDNDNIH